MTNFIINEIHWIKNKKALMNEHQNIGYKACCWLLTFDIWHLRKITPFLGKTKSQKSNLTEQTIDLKQNFKKRFFSSMMPSAWDWDFILMDIKTVKTVWPERFMISFYPCLKPSLMAICNSVGIFVHINLTLPFPKRSNEKLNYLLMKDSFSF